MAAPTPTARTTPTGDKIDNGHKVLITLAVDPDIKIWEIDVGVPGVDCGEPIKTTTQHNVDYDTFAPKDLLTLTPYTIKFQYAAESYTQLLAVAGVETTITHLFPNTTTLAYYGFAQKFDFDPLVIGQPGTGTLTIVPTNWDPAGNVEAGPVFTALSPPPPP